MCLWCQRQWKTHVRLCSTSTSPPKQQRNWRISSKSLPWPNIVVNPRTSSRMSRLGGGQVSYVEEATISTRGNQPLCGWQSARFWSCQPYTWRVASVSSGRSHPPDNGILAAHPWGWEVCHWFSCASGNFHHSPIILAGYCICWKWAICEKANEDPTEWLWSTLSPNHQWTAEILKRRCTRIW